MGAVYVSVPEPVADVFMDITGVEPDNIMIDEDGRKWRAYFLIDEEVLDDFEIETVLRRNKINYRIEDEA